MNKFPALCMLVVLAFLLSGCSSIGPGREGLTGRDRGHLQARAEPPAAHGVVIETPVQGGLRVRGAYRMDPYARAVVPLIRHLESGSRNPVIPIQLNGHPLTASIDTGASVSMLTLDAAEQTGIRPVGPELIELPIVTFRGTRHPVLAVADRMQLGTLAIRKIPFGVLRRIPGMPRHTEDSLAEVDAILGQDLLGQFGLIRFEAGPQEFHLAGRSALIQVEPSRVIDRFPLTRGPTGIPVFSAWISGRGPVPVAFDSGGGFGLWIPSKTASSLRLADADRALERVLNRSFKPSAARPARPSSLRAGRFLADGLPTLIGTIQGGEKSPTFVLLGNYLLKTTSVAIDYRSGTILFLHK